MKEADLPRGGQDTREPEVEEQQRRVYLCDRCGFEMVEQHCKVVCPNCGSRWDCSDLTIYTDETGPDYGVGVGSGNGV